MLGLVTDFGGDATGKRYALLNATYFIGYVAFRKLTFMLHSHTVIPGSLLGKRTKPNIVMAAAAICWGACAALTAATNSWAQASGTRFLVGVFGEASPSDVLTCRGWIRPRHPVLHYPVVYAFRVGAENGSMARVGSNQVRTHWC